MSAKKLSERSETVRISLCLTQTMWKKIQGESKKENLAASELIRNILETFLAVDDSTRSGKRVVL